MKMTPGGTGLTPDSSAFWQNRFSQKGENISVFSEKFVPNEILVNHKVTPKTIEQYDEVMEMYESPEARTAEKIEFEEKFKDPEAVIDLDGTKMKVKDLREMFKEDNDYFSAISSCGLPKGDA
jgi:hypothetical protein